MAIEIVPIPGHPNYGVTLCGLVYRIRGGKNVRKPVPYEVRGYSQRNGRSERLLVSIGKARYVHHLVLETFVGPRPNGMECCHCDGDASNNHLSNLRWDTKASNESDKVLHGTAPIGSSNHNAKLTNADVEWILAYPERRGMFREMAERLQMSKATICQIYTRKRWKHLSPQAKQG
jgi:hypothetical protein